MEITPIASPHQGVQLYPFLLSLAKEIHRGYDYYLYDLEMDI